MTGNGHVDGAILTAPAKNGAANGGAGDPKPAADVPAPNGDDVVLAAGKDWFSDVRGGFWAAVTTAFCVVIGGGSHLILLTADLGSQPATNSPLWNSVPTYFAIGIPSLVVGLLAFTIAWRSKTDAKASRPALRATLFGIVAAGLTAAGLLALATTAWLSENGRQVAWQPIVGCSIAMVAIASFGGYFLASRRARVGIASSFVLTFFLLFSYLLTLKGLNSAIAEAAAGAAATAAAQNGADPQAIAGAAANASTAAVGATQAGGALQDILGEFRGYVALIIAFYFGTDAAVSAVKIFKAKDEDASEISRLDRDLAAPRTKA